MTRRKMMLKKLNLSRRKHGKDGLIRLFYRQLLKIEYASIFLF